MLRDSPVIHPWAPEILLELASGPTRFNALLKSIEGISDRMLHLRLQELAEARVIDRQVITGPPIRVVYSLTAEGRRYIQPLAALDAIASGNRQEVAVG